MSKLTGGLGEASASNGLLQQRDQPADRRAGEALPGVGPKSAQRLAFHIINMPEEAVDRLASSITEAKHSVRYCKKCCTLTDQELCPICSSTSRDTSTIMVVENTQGSGSL